MLLTCVAAVAVVWFALWSLIRLEGTMGEAGLPRDGSPATRQLPGHAHLWPDAAERMTRTCSKPAQPPGAEVPSCPGPLAGMP